MFDPYWIHHVCDGMGYVTLSLFIGLFVSFILFDVSFLTNCLSVCIKTDEDEGGEDLDPYELMTAVDILAKIPKDFFEKIVS